MNKHIKYLIETTFGFNIDDYDDDTDVQSKLAFDNFVEIMEKTLCRGTNYNVPKPTNDFPLVWELEPNTKYLVCPHKNYEDFDRWGPHKKLGPRVRKRYPIEQFYTFTVELKNGGVDLQQNRSFNKKNKAEQQFVISEVVYDFIAKSPLPINSLKMKVQDDYTPTTQNYIDQNEPYSLLIFKNDGGQSVFKYSSQFVYNLPDQISPIPSPKLQDITFTKSPNLFHVKSSQFENEQDFHTFLEKIVNWGFPVIDEKFTIYNKSNINSVISSQNSNTKQMTNLTKHGQFIVDQIGQDCYDKLSEIIEYYNNRNQTCYLYRFNKLRNDKLIAYDPTIIQLCKANNIMFDEEVMKIKHIKGIVLYKMFNLMKTYKLMDYKTYYDLDQCINGYEKRNNYTYEMDFKELDLNDLQIKYTDPDKLYNFYFVIGLALKQCKGLDKIDIPYSTYLGYNKQGDKEEFVQFDTEFIEQLNANISDDISMINFDFLNKQLITCIKHYYKKMQKDLEKLKR